MFLYSLSEVENIRKWLNEEEGKIKSANRIKKQFYYYHRHYIYLLTISYAYEGIEYWSLGRAPQGGEEEVGPEEWGEDGYGPHPLADSIMGFIEDVPEEVASWTKKKCGEDYE